MRATGPTSPALQVAQASLGHASVPTTAAYVQTDLSQQYQGCADLRTKCLGSAAAIFGAGMVEEETGRKAALKGARLQYEKRMSPA